jgi:CO dehydrogenase/acetyl-CoA synthase beta subunit
MKKKKFVEEECCTKGKMNCGPCTGGIYFLGFIGAAIYYISQSATFWQGVVGFLKALVWPVFLVYKLLGL